MILKLFMAKGNVVLRQRTKFKKNYILKRTDLVPITSSNIKNRPATVPIHYSLTERSLVLNI